MDVNVKFMLKHCFSTKTAQIQKRYSAIQHHQHLKITMKDAIFELANSYKLMNPITGVIPESHFGTTSQVESEDNSDRLIEVSSR